MSRTYSNRNCFRKINAGIGHSFVTSLLIVKKVFKVCILNDSLFNHNAVLSILKFDNK